jgi:hypothetical protein
MRTFILFAMFAAALGIAVAAQHYGEGLASFDRVMHTPD